MITPAAAIADKNLLAPSFVGPSWDLWRAILKATFAERMTAAEKARFRQVAEREPPKRRVRELWTVAGRRSGKDSMAAAIATTASMGDYSPHLRPGERASIVCIASDRNQAKIVFRYILGNFNSVPLLTPMLERVTEDTIELNNRVEIIVTTNSFRAVRGRSVVLAIFDEVAFWKDESSATPDVETYKAVEPGLATFPTGMMIGISSPHRRAGLLYERWQKYYGTDDDEVLVVRGPSKLFNPTLPQSVIDRAMERDPEAAAAEYGAEWRTDLVAFVSPEVVEACTPPGRFELPPMAGVAYTAFTDPSGGSSDSMTLAISHMYGDTPVLDCIREVKAPFSPESVVLEFAAVLRAYGLNKVTGDRYGGEWPRERFSEAGITYEISERTKAEIYLNTLPLLNSGTAELLDIPNLTKQLCGLERRAVRGGRASIDHAPGAHDDVANAACGALLLAGKPAMAFCFGSIPMNETRSLAERYPGLVTAF